MSAKGSEDANLAIFRDCLFNSIVERSASDQKARKSRQRATSKPKALSTAGENKPRTANVSSSTSVHPGDPSQLVDFSDYLAEEIFPTLPEDLRSISHQVLVEDVSLSDKWSLPLSLTVYEELTELIPASVNDNLEAYGLTKPPKSDLQSFIAPLIAAYLSAATTPPPKWGATRASACEICERDWINLTYHHLIPKAVHAKVLKRGWHDEQQLNSVAWLCRSCHSFVHRMASNEELAKEFYTVERICEREDVQKFAAWVGKIRWKKR